MQQISCDSAVFIQIQLQPHMRFPPAVTVLWQFFNQWSNIAAQKQSEGWRAVAVKALASLTGFVLVRRVNAFAITRSYSLIHYAKRSSNNVAATTAFCMESLVCMAYSHGASTANIAAFEAVRLIVGAVGTLSDMLLAYFSGLATIADFGTASTNGFQLAVVLAGAHHNVRYIRQLATQNTTVRFLDGTVSQTVVAMECFYCIRKFLFLAATAAFVIVAGRHDAIELRQYELPHSIINDYPL